MPRHPLLVAALLCAPLTVFAHARPDRMVPASGSTVAAPPALQLHFTEALEPALSHVELTGPGGKPVATAAAQIDASDRRSLQLTLPALAAGRYTVHWTAVASDGHRTRGEYVFQVK